MKALFLISIMMTFLLSRDSNLVQQQNVLGIQKIITMEEEIAKQFEKYLLTEFKIPSLSELINDDYLGSNFSTSNRFGPTITLTVNKTTAPFLSLSYAVTKALDANNLEIETYVNGLYSRDLYRNLTTANDETGNYFTSFELESTNAQQIFNILKTISGSIEKSCSDTLVSKYCMVNDDSIRWYNSVSNWIEYDLTKLNEGSATVNLYSMLSDVKALEIKVGKIVYLKNGSKYIKNLNGFAEVN